MRTVALTILLILGACTILPGPKAARYGGLQSGNTLTMVADPQGSQLAQRLVGVALIERGFRLAPQSRYLVEVTLARRDDGIAFAGSSVRSLPHGLRLALCSSSVYRLRVAIVEARSGAVQFTGAAEEQRCDPPDDLVLYAMTQAALGSLD